MKKTCLLFFLLFVMQDLSATHIIGGSLTYEHITGNEYTIRLEVFRDCYLGNPNAYFDDPASVGIFDSNNQLVDEKLLDFSGQDDTISLVQPGSVCVYPEGVCVHKAVYEANITLPSTGVYTLAYQRCCRTQTIQNLVDPLTTGMTFRTQINTAIENSSAQFNSDIPLTVFVGTAFSYNASATDPDGDSLVYELSTPSSGADQNIPRPQPPNPPPYISGVFANPTFSITNMLGGNYPLTINSETGEMTAIPYFLGNFQIGYSIKEYRNGVLINTIYREFVFVVMNTFEGQNYDVAGSVLVESGSLVNVLDVGTVEILQRDIVEDLFSLYEEQMIIQPDNGVYNFDNIPVGVFYMKATPDENSLYSDFLPTYFGDALFWYNAEPINQCDTFQENRDIHLIQVEELVSGSIILQGKVKFPNEDPVNQLDLLIGTEDGTIIKATTTDELGNFSFEGLSETMYKLYVDLVNSNIDNTNPPVFTLSSSTNTAEVYLHDTELTISVTPTGVQSIAQQNSHSVTIYPNPTMDRFQVDIDVKTVDVFTIKVYNIYGQCVKTVIENQMVSSGLLSKEIRFNDFAAGLYFVEIESSKGRTIEKLIKQ